MVLLNDKELINIVGGGITATLINSIARGINTVLDLGRTVGTAIKMIVSGKTC